MAVTTSWISKKPDRCGGEACVRDTRITVWGLVNSRRLGIPDGQLLDGIIGLQPADLEAAWEYAAGHAEEIERARANDRSNPRGNASPSLIESGRRSPDLGKCFRHYFLGVRVIRHDRASERKRHPPEPIVQLAEGSLVTTCSLRDESGVRGVDPRRVNRHILQG